MRLLVVSALTLALAACQAESPAPPAEPAAPEPPEAPAASAAPEAPAAASAAAHVGLMAHEPWTRPLAPGATVAAGYLQLMNHTAQAETLVSASAEGVGRIEIHDMEEVDGLMQMRPVEGGLPLAADAMVALQPGGKHLMFLDVTRSWAAGETVPVTLAFASGQTLAVAFQIGEGDADHAEQSGGHDH